jgi:hypothetical protein
LPSAVDAGKVEAIYGKGILLIIIILSKVEEATAKNIEFKVKEARKDNLTCLAPF